MLYRNTERFVPVLTGINAFAIAKRNKRNVDVRDITFANFIYRNYLLQADFSGTNLRNACKKQTWLIY